MIESPGLLMIVECAQCQTKFKIADEKITPKGVKVRCSKCKHMFVVKPEGVEAPSEKPAIKTKEKTEGIPDDIFRAPTRVESRPPTPPPGKKFPLPPPSVPAPKGTPKGAAEPAAKTAAKAGPSLADKIDLDSDEPVSAPPKIAEPPLDQMPTMPNKPSAMPKGTAKGAESAAPPPPPAPPSQPPPTSETAAAAGKSDLGDALFSDLSLEAPPPPAAKPAAKPVAKPQEKKAPAPLHSSAASPVDDDPFAGIDVSAPAPATPQPPPAAEKPPPWAAPKGTPVSATEPAAPPGPDPVSSEAVGQPTKDLFDDLGDPFAGIPSTGADAEPPDGQELLPSGGSDLPAELAGGPPPEEAPAPAPAMPKGTAKGAETPSPGRPQDDIFANIDSVPAQAGGTPSPAESDDDPFAGIDTSVPSDAPAAGAPDSLIGDDDPFGQVDASGPAGMPGADPDEGGMQSGLELDSEGQLTGEPIPEPPPPTKSAPVQESQPAPAVPRPAAAPPMPMAGPEPSKAPPTGILWAYKVGFGLLALVVVLLLFVAYRSGGKPDLTSWSTYVRAFTGDESAEEVAGDLEAVEVRNTAYRTRGGHPLLVVWGKVNNKTKDQKAAVVVSGQLLSEKGEELGKFTAPAGVTFTPQEVYEMTDHLAVASAYHSRLEKVADLKVPPEGAVPFMLVFYDHPEEMEDMRIRVLPKESQDPLRGLPPETEPAEGEGDDQEAAAEGGVVVKKKGTIVRLKPKDRGAEDVEEVDEEDVEDIPVEVVEEVEGVGEVEDIEEVP
jgi:predicted Zn finger-like uncharacterized protein